MAPIFLQSSRFRREAGGVNRLVGQVAWTVAAERKAERSVSWMRPLLSKSDVEAYLRQGLASWLSYPAPAGGGPGGLLTALDAHGAGAEGGGPTEDL